MNTRLMTTGLSLAVCASATAAGINWTYDGSVGYDKVIIVWTDGRTNVREFDDEVQERWNATREKLLSDQGGITIKTITDLCARDDAFDKIYAQVFELNGEVVRVHNESLHFDTVKGWGFSLLVNVDNRGFITDFALNKPTPGDINSLPDISPTALTIKDEDLTPYVSRYGKNLLAEAGEPLIVPHDANAGSERASLADDMMTIRFDITNAVNGFIYQVVESDAPTGTFTRNPALDRFARADGRLAFEIPIDPNVRAKFYRIRVGAEE